MSKLVLLTLGIPGMSFLVLVAAAAAETLPGLGALLVPTIVIVLLVLLNGFFVTAEFAIIGVRSTQVEQQVEEGDSQARGVMDILQSRTRQDEYIATAQLGITIASLGLAMYGEPQIAHFVEPYLAQILGAEPTTAVVNSIGYIIALSLLTYLHIVIGEMVPKSLALSNAMRMALFVAWPMQLAQTILSLPVRLLNGVGAFLLRLLKVPPAQGHARVLSPEELELIVAESAESGLLKEEEEEMILNIFDFSEREAGQVMTPRTKVQAIAHDMPRDELLTFVTESQHSRFPVYQGDLDHIIGILHVKDLVRQAIKTVKSKGSLDIRLILRSAPAVPEDYPVPLLLAAFKRQQLHMAIVLDEFGGLAGIVTLEDLVEEIVGEVRDEFDLEKEPFVELGPGTLEVAGHYLVDDLIEEIYLGNHDDLPDVETVGGLVVTWLGRPPQKGDELYRKDIHFKVLDVDRRAVSRVRIEYPTSEEVEQNETTGAAAESATDSAKTIEP
jgi:CBS domain containing-hemolysin-like protein